MSRLAGTFARLKQAGRCALVPYVTGGDPDAETCVAVLHALVKAGADVIELGVPFSDPAADGPVIQRACERALKTGTTLAGVLDMVRAFRTRDAQTPVVLMGYLNPMEAFGIERFVDEAATAGVDGVLTVDMPPEEAEPLAGLLRERGLDPIFLLAPTTSGPRLRRICEVASGFVYYVSLKGVTGAGTLDVAAVAQRLAAIRSHTELPVGVGFGVHDAQAAAALAARADAVIVGSALIERIAARQGQRERLLTDVGDFIAGLRRAMDAA